jgi:ABC-type branched-subunit amino acid transport system substrate-binding protein
MAAPIRVGLLDDMAAGPPGVSTIEPWLRQAVDDVLASGRLDRDVEFVPAYGLGLPAGTAAAVEQAYRELVELGVLLIVGPAIGDNELVATPLADRLRVPTLNWAGAERARGEYMFQLQVGSHEDEAIVIARHLAACGATRVGVVYDRSPIGERYLGFLHHEAAVLDLEIAAATPISPLADDATAQVGRVVAANADALAYLGLGVSAPAVARAAEAHHHLGPRIMNSAGIRGYQPRFAREIAGWTYVDLHDDGNTALNRLQQRLGFADDRRLAAAKGHDLGRLVAEALVRAPSLTRDGVREGLELVKWLPAAEGREGTLLGFGPFDRGALHGRYLVLRRWLDGVSVQVDEA